MLEALAQFVQVVEAGSFSKAATRLNRNASSVARQIDKLELELNTKLFLRSTRRLELTPQGESLYRQCLDILLSVDRVRESFASCPEDVEGEVCITAIDSYGSERIVPILPQFLQRYPRAHVVLSLNNTIVDLNEGKFDLAVRHGRPVDSTFISKPLEASTPVLLASPKYLAKHSKITSPEDLKAHACLTLYRHRAHTYWYFKREAEQQKIRVNSVLAADGGAPLLRWTMEGMGIAMLTTWCCEQHIQSGALQVLLPDWTPGFDEQQNKSVYLLWSPAKAQRPVVRAMIDFLTDSLAVAR